MSRIIVNIKSMTREMLEYTHLGFGARALIQYKDTILPV